MRFSSLFIAIIGGVLAVAAAACTNSQGNTAATAVQPDSAARVARGAYLVSITGCDDCHSPKRMGPRGPEIIPELRLSGFPHNGQLPALDSSEIAKGWTLLAPDLTSAVGVWGASFAGNITSDATGIGNWKEENFIRALREGKYKGLANGRNLLPPMPWFAYKNMSDEDLKSIFAYLKTTRPVSNVVPAPKALAALK